MRRRKAPDAALAALTTAAVVLAASCFDAAYRWEELIGGDDAAPSTCSPGGYRCALHTLERCEAGAAGPTWVAVEDCAQGGLVCSSALGRCTTCAPGARTCEGQDIVVCGADGETREVVQTCDTAAGQACRSGGCLELCTLAKTQKSNVGCEYWPVDLDNAMLGATSNAAGQQFAVVVSNPQPDVATEVRIYQDDGEPGAPPAPYEIASAVIPPLNLRVFKLGPREVDGSPPGEFDTGTHTALTRRAFKVVSQFPVVAYQFSPLENVAVFSNDASLLKPREAFDYGGELRPAYVVAGWPQTIAVTDDPDTNWSSLYPTNLRAFLTIVGTRENTKVRVKTRTAVVGGGPIPETPAGGWIEATLGPFDVLNLETGDFNADFTGSIVEADGPVAVFTGSEASDAPHFETLSERQCCADHLEDQLDPLRTAGKTFVVPHNPSRTRAVAAAGVKVAVVPEPDYVRFVSASPEGATITTTLPYPDDVIELKYLGDWAEVTAYGDFLVHSSNPIVVEQVMASQDAAGVKRGLPGGDPSLLIVPPIEQYRPDYVFLTPDKYAFDFVSIVAPPDATVALDDVVLANDGRCEAAPADGLSAEQRGTDAPPLLVYRCQLSFPVIDGLKNPPEILPGAQNDGVHRIVANAPVGVVVTGFDAYVSYSYAGGTDLEEIAPPL